MFVIVCARIPDKRAPTASSCPSDVGVVSPKRFAQLTLKKPTFRGHKVIKVNYKGRKPHQQLKCSINCCYYVAWLLVLYFIRPFLVWLQCQCRFPSFLQL